MSQPSHTVINVAIANKSRKQWNSDKPVMEHFFRVEIETHPANCQEQIKELQKKFPAPKYEVSISYWQCSGQYVDPNTLDIQQ